MKHSVVQVPKFQEAKKKLKKNFRLLLKEGKMKKIRIVFIIIICFPAFTFAQEIYGNIKVGSRPIGEGTRVEIRSAGGNIYADSTDMYGSYSIYVGELGRCELTVRYGGDPSPSITAYSYQGSVRYNLILIRFNGNYKIRRQ